MSLDLVKLREYGKEIKKKAEQEAMQNISRNLVEFVLDQDFKDNFRDVKGRKITEQSKRVIGHWVKKGIIDAEQENEGGWYFFTRMESIWIDIVTELREFGLGLDEILIVKKQLFQNVVQKFKLIDFAIMHSVLSNPYLMLVYSDGKISVMSAKTYSSVIAKEPLPPHITFNFFHLAKNIFPNNNFSLGIENPDFESISSNEMKLLFYLRTGNYDEIKIRLKSGEIYLLEGKKKIQQYDNLMEIIRQANYQNIEIKTENGRISHIETTEKIKL